MKMKTFLKCASVCAFASFWLLVGMQVVAIR